VDSLRRRLRRDGVRLESGYRTTFELLTTVAFETFREAGVDLAIVETGLGGRLDATNVVEPQVAVITAIGLDHTHLLGTSARAIAREKAGIVKAGHPVVVGRQPRGDARDVLEVIRRRCREVAVAARAESAHYAPRRVEILSRVVGHGGQRVRCRWRRSGAELAVDLPLLGGHQAENLRTALATIEVLRARGWSIPDGAIRAGAAQVEWPGRVEWMGGKPPLVLDGAHCPLSVEALVETMRELKIGVARSARSARQPVFLFSLLDDKTLDAIVTPVARRFGGCPMVVFQAPSVRGCSPKALLRPLQDHGFLVETARGPADAVRRAIARADRNSVLVAFGSLYSVAPLRKAYQRLTGHGRGE
jgi:dihydrofolate synthase/folylpolyglutamate synthase